MKVKMSKEERRLKRSKEIYERVKDELGLNGDRNEQIGQLIQEACKVQLEINEKNNTITESGYEKALELIKIDKPTWNEFVNLTAKKYYGRLNEKQVDKYEETCNSKRHIINLKQSFFDSYLSDNPLKVVDEYDKQSYNFDNEENKEFSNLLEDNAKIKDFIVSTLNNRFRDLHKCAFYLSEGELKESEFRELVQFECYKDSDDEKHPDKLWKLFERFNKMARLMNKYNNENISEHMGNMCKEFGIFYSLHTEQPKMHPWQMKNDEEE